MGKQTAKDGVGQLELQIVFPETETSDGTRLDEDNGPDASDTPAATGRSTSTRRKWYSLIDKVWKPDNLATAWERVRANQGAAGADGMSVAKFAEQAGRWLAELAADLRAKTYRPHAVRRVYIPKSGGGQRPLGIPSVRDRIVQQAVRQVLEPIFEETFSERSHGFRKDRGCATALEVVDQAVRHGYQWVVDADIEAFFDSVDHTKLLAAVNQQVADGSVLRLIAAILKAGVIEPGATAVDPSELGTPQGGPLSPLLANIYLHSLDEAVSTAGYGLVRYADDFVIFARSEAAATAACELAREHLAGLGLRLHPEKTRVVPVARGFEFLGYHWFWDEARACWRKEVRRKSVHRFRERVRELTPRLRNQRKPKERSKALRLPQLKRNQRLQRTLAELNAYLRGWHWYFKEVWSPWPDRAFDRFDSFLRRRVRLALTGRVGNGWWNAVLTNAVLREVGLLSLDQLQAEHRRARLTAPVRKDALGGEPYAGKPHVRFGAAGRARSSP